MFAFAIPAILAVGLWLLRLRSESNSSTVVDPSSQGRIDTHIHALPPAYARALADAGGDPSGFPTPDWTLEAAIQSMDVLGVHFGFLSISTPGVPIAGTGASARLLARTLNEDLANYSTSHASRLGFFATLPDWRDVEGTLAEIDYLYTHQRRCHGVAIFTGYGDRLPGDAIFRPIWQALQAHRALVFLHPGPLAGATPRFLGGGLPQPILDYPLATTRAAVDLVVSGVVRDHPDVDFILSHAGGALPFLGGRVEAALRVPGVVATLASAVDAETARADLARFYYDTALSATPAQLHGLLDFAGGASRILFGSDFPYAPPAVIADMAAQHTRFIDSDPRGGEVATGVLRDNALALLARHAPRPGKDDETRADL